MRSILSIIAGVLVGVFGVFLVKMINLSLYPNHADLNVSDPDLAAFVLIIIAHILGAFIAAFIASMVARTKRLNVGLLAGAILLSFTIWNSFSIGPPNVVSILDIVGTSLAVFLGAKMGASRIVG
ncbi:MAG: hypothetical protein HN488_05180 [Saprospiraceae bacterium]|jgi:hypothetical protein|nr:hypothetical protein [Saprospiraceae bacterium]MDA9181801.1 hypothetical protein [Saprospiraceae bacterium]MDA9358634.1 hypothetical protein [Saprospiraceae bacterium]HAV29855.1 hypothetical protein [Saprospirales bacterium]